MDSKIKHTHEYESDKTKFTHSHDGGDKLHWHNGTTDNISLYSEPLVGPKPEQMMICPKVETCKLEKHQPCFAPNHSIPHAEEGSCDSCSAYCPACIPAPSTPASVLLPPDELLTDEEIKRQIIGLEDKGIVYCCQVVLGYYNLKCHQSEAAEIKELRERVESWEDLESSVCPEDYSISEYINSLLIKINDFTKKVETAEAINRGLEIKEIAVNSANKDYKARIKELEELNYKQSQMKCNRCPYNNPQEAAIRADQKGKIFDVLDPLTVGSSDSDQRELLLNAIAKLQKGESPEAHS